MNALDYLKEYSAKADKYLDTFLKDKKKTAAELDPIAKRVLEDFQQFTSGGKKVRGALTYLGYKMVGGESSRAILPVSVGIELLHNFLLIHDDIIDKDKERRGRPTLHVSQAEGKGEHFGLSKAIITGDAGAFLGYELVASSEFPKEKIVRALSVLNDFLLKTAYGEILDIEFDYKKKIDWQDILKVRTYKTAYYTIVMPLAVGATLGGASGKTLLSIQGYGIPVGLAFQLRDDILGVFGETKKTGKSNISDIKEGKKTLLIAKAVEMAKKDDKSFIKKWYGKNPGVREVERIKEIIKNSGALSYSESLARELVEEGKSKIVEVTKNEKWQEILRQLADFMVERGK